MPFMIENLTVQPIKVGGWYDDYNRQSARIVKTLLPGQKLEIDEGALNNPIIRDLQARSVIRISEVDLIPLNSQENEWEDLEINSTEGLEERVAILEAGGGGGGPPTGPAAGDLTGIYPAPQVSAVSALEGAALDDVLKADGIGGWTVGAPPGGPPSGAAGGDLSLTYPNPSVSTVGGATAANLAGHLTGTTNPHNTSIANLNSGTLLELNSKITGATLDDISDSRPPNGTAGGDLSGSYPDPTILSVPASALPAGVLFCTSITTSEAQSSITGIVGYVTKLSFSPGGPFTGTYRLAWYSEFNHSASNDSTDVRTLRTDVVTTIAESGERPSDSTTWNVFSGHQYITFTAESPTFEIQFRTNNAANTAFIRRARIELCEVT